jgi:hypothetical protein
MNTSIDNNVALKYLKSSTTEAPIQFDLLENVVHLTLLIT